MPIPTMATVPPPEPIVVEIEVVEEVEEVVEYNPYCSCITTARILGINLPKGDAKDLVANSTLEEGEAVLMRFWDYYSGVWNYHVAKYWILPSGNLYLDQGNKVKCVRNQETISPDDKNIIGYWAE